MKRSGSTAGKGEKPRGTTTTTTTTEKPLHTETQAFDIHKSVPTNRQHRMCGHTAQQKLCQIYRFSMNHIDKEIITRR